MTIKVKKQVDEEIQLEVPAFFRFDAGRVIKITEDTAVLTNDSLIAVFRKRDACFDSYVWDALKSQPITEEEFKETFRKVSDRLNDLAGFSIVPSLQLQD